MSDKFEIEGNDMTGKFMTTLKELVKEYTNDILEEFQNKSKVVNNGGHDDYSILFDSKMDIERILYEFAEEVERRT